MGVCVRADFIYSACFSWTPITVDWFLSIDLHQMEQLSCHSLFFPILTVCMMSALPSDILNTHCLSFGGLPL